LATSRVVAMRFAGATLPEASERVEDEAAELAGGAGNENCVGHVFTFVRAFQGPFGQGLAGRRLRFLLSVGLLLRLALIW
jgi:hypothetical protein